MWYLVYSHNFCFLERVSMSTNRKVTERNLRTTEAGKPPFYVNTRYFINSLVHGSVAVLLFKNLKL